MTRKWLAGFLCLLVLGSVAAAEPEKVPPPKAIVYSDVQDLLFLGDQGPVLMRVHVQIDGKPYQAQWEDFLDSLFAFFDRNDDGVLSADEANRCPRPEVLVQVRQSGFFAFNQRAATMAELDANKDNKVSREEFGAYYRNASVRSLQVTPAFNNFGSGALSDTLFKQLDVNNDGKLSKEELMNAVNLRKLDIDDDEVISVAELGSNQFGFQQPARGMAPGQLPAFFIGVDAAEGPSRHVATLLNHYDKDKNQKLSRAEIGLDDLAFNLLDANQDGALDATELAAFFRAKPTLELAIRVGKLDGKEAVERIAGGDKYKVETKVNGSALVTIGNAQIDFGRFDNPQQANNTFQFYGQQFAQADKDKKGFVEMKDLNVPQFQALRSLFAMADRNGDGKMTKAELDLLFEVQRKGTTSYTSLSVGDSGQGLFETLDANRDGRLSIRELRTAWSRLAPWDKDGDSFIAKHEIPRQFQLAVGRGQNFGRGFGAPAVVQNPANPAPSPARGPLWFRKMDRNGDGDVSLREFLGTREDFKKIDLDGDGLISVEEGEKANEWFAKNAQK